MDPVPNLQTILRIATLAARLPFANPKAYARVWLVAAHRGADDPGDTVRAIWALRQLDWLALYRHFGSTRSWLSGQARATSPETLLALLEDDLRDRQAA